MVQLSILDTSRTNPFSNALPVAHCEAGAQGLVRGREIAAASVAVNPDGKDYICINFLLTMHDLYPTLCVFP